jgi:hypothetical protein
MQWPHLLQPPFIVDLIEAICWGNLEMLMSTRSSVAIAAIAAGTMVAFSLTPASAFTLSAPSLSQPVSASQIDKVWWRGGGCGWGRCGWGHGFGWHGYGWRGYGWGPGAVIGGLAAGAVVGALAAPYYYAPPPASPCWRDSYGRVVCN